MGRAHRCDNIKREVLEIRAQDGRCWSSVPHTPSFLGGIIGESEPPSDGMNAAHWYGLRCGYASFSFVSSLLRSHRCIH